MRLVFFCRAIAIAGLFLLCANRSDASSTSQAARATIPLGATAVRPLAAGKAPYCYFKILHSFQGPPADGAFPYGSLISVDGALYGTTTGIYPTYNGSTIYTIDRTGRESVVHTFGGAPDGLAPGGNFVTIGNTIYGTTQEGGLTDQAECFSGCGTVYAYTPATGSERVIYRFHRVPDGIGPSTGVTAFDGALYGVTPAGGEDPVGNGGYGTVYRVSLSGAESVLHIFTSGTDGQNPGSIEYGENPVTSLTPFAGELYGTTPFGGGVNAPSGNGTVFTLSASGAEQTVHAFHGGIDGSLPNGGLTEVGGALYGTTQYGGIYGDPYSGSRSEDGTAFEVNRLGQLFVLHSFGNGDDGVWPATPLTSIDGTLYGLTTFGGAYGRGTVFALTTTGAERVIYSFGAPGKHDGAFPTSLTAIDGVLYGTTLQTYYHVSGGGTTVEGDGVVFALKP